MHGETLKFTMYEVHYLNIRRHLDTHIQFCKTEHFKESLVNMGITLYT